MEWCQFKNVSDIEPPQNTDLCLTIKEKNAVKKKSYLSLKPFYNKFKYIFVQ